MSKIKETSEVNETSSYIEIVNGEIEIVNGEYIPASEVKIKEWSESEYLTEGNLIIGSQYRIEEYIPGDDFTNVGGINESYLTFIANESSPKNWKNKSKLESVWDFSKSSEIPYIKKESKTDFYDITKDVTIPKNMGVELIEETPFTISENVTLTIEGEIKAGLYQIFKGNGKVLFSKDSLTKEVYPEWFGAHTNKYVSDNEAIQRTFSSVENTEIKIILNSIYKISGSIFFTPQFPYTTLVQGKGVKTGLFYISNDTKMNLFISEKELNRIQFIRFKDMSIFGKGFLTNHILFENVTFLGDVLIDDITNNDNSSKTCKCIIENGMIKSICELHKNYYKNISNTDIEELNYSTLKQTNNIDEGNLIIEKTYRIEQYNENDNFENVGGANKTDSIFIATEETPNDWNHGSLLRQIGVTPKPDRWIEENPCREIGTISNKSIPTPRIEISFKKTIDDLKRRVFELENKKHKESILLNKYK